MRYLREDFIFLSIKSYLRSHGWNLLGGEPPDGTSDDLIRIYIRAEGIRDRLHSLGAVKIDLMSVKDGVLLLTEVKPRFSMTDKLKLDLIAGPRKMDLFRALYERCKIEPDRITLIVKSLGFTASSTAKVFPDYVFFCVHSDGTVDLTTGDTVDSKTFE